MLMVKKGGSRMTLLFSWLKNPIWFVRLFLASTVLVLLLSFFSYRQIRGQLGFASPSVVMGAVPDSGLTMQPAEKPAFDPVNRNRAYLQNVCRVRPSGLVKPKKIFKKKVHSHSIVRERELLKRERELQRRAAALQQVDSEPVATSHIITHNGETQYVSAEQEENPTKIASPNRPPKQHVSRSRAGYSGSFSLPIKRSQFWLSSPFGPRRKANGRRGFHQGIDLAAVRGTPVMAAGDGVVVFAGNGGPFGNLVIIEHDERCRTWYAHLSAIKTHVGAQVSVGKVVGLVGATGYVRKRRGGSGDHLHFGVYIDGRAVNPVHYLN